MSYNQSLEKAVQGVLTRLLGNRSDSFSLRHVPASSTADWFTVCAKRGEVEIEGSSASALCRGAYDYLKKACHVQVSWSGDEVTLPDKLPDYEGETVVCKNQIRLYLSVCTFGYSTVWWDWPRWEREIDWMALHGINMPLALVGQELIWQRVFRSLGLTEAEIERHFSGPAYLPWHRLGNLNGHMGPLSQSWIDSQAALQSKILDRERELGMKPVVPGFSGFVPEGFRQVYPEVQLHSAEPWVDFAATTFVDPRDPIYEEIGRCFVTEYRKEFGPAHHYLCETFAEQTPRIEAGMEVDYLRSLGGATWNAISAADPDAHWVMQGWPFQFARDFWLPERVAALFEPVPDGRLIVIDQLTEEFEVWRHQLSVRDRGWIHAFVHNFGQTTHLHGDLPAMASRAWDAQTDPNNGNRLGSGMLPEGIDQNPVVYELMTDAMWAESPSDVSLWVQEYVASRYGGLSDGALAAWNILLATVYGPEGDLTLTHSWRFRPEDQPLARWQDTAQVGVAVTYLLRSAREFGGNPRYRRDLVDITKTWLGGLADASLNAALSSINDDVQYAIYRSLFFETLIDIDRLLATLPEHNLSTWVHAARVAAASPEESDHNQHNALSLITHWGGRILFDYATREWAGLTKDFHLARWRAYFEFKEAAASGRKVVPPDFATWEADWARNYRVPPETAQEDPLTVAQELAANYSNSVAYSQLPERFPSTIYGPKAATRLGDGLSSLTLLIDTGHVQPCCGVAIFPIYGQGVQARYSLRYSMDGQKWETISELGHALFRGDRWKLDTAQMRYLEIGIHLISGNLEQVFNVVVVNRN